jgi:hypothetical protein
MEQLDLKDLNEKINAATKQRPEILDPNVLKKSLVKLKSFIKYFSNVIVLNRKKIDILKKPVVIFEILTNSYLHENEIVTLQGTVVDIAFIQDHKVVR